MHRPQRVLSVFKLIIINFAPISVWFIFIIIFLVFFAVYVLIIDMAWKINVYDLIIDMKLADLLLLFYPIRYNWINKCIDVWKICFYYRLYPSFKNDIVRHTPKKKIQSGQLLQVCAWSKIHSILIEVVNVRRSWKVSKM